VNQLKKQEFQKRDLGPKERRMWFMVPVTETNFVSFTRRVSARRGGEGFVHQTFIPERRGGWRAKLVFLFGGSGKKREPR